MEQINNYWLCTYPIYTSWKYSMTKAHTLPPHFFPHQQHNLLLIFRSHLPNADSRNLRRTVATDICTSTMAFAAHHRQHRVSRREICHHWLFTVWLTQLFLRGFLQTSANRRQLSELGQYTSDFQRKNYLNQGISSVFLVYAGNYKYHINCYSLFGTKHQR